jgi:hypothetical protein
MGSEIETERGAGALESGHNRSNGVGNSELGAASGGDGACLSKDQRRILEIGSLVAVILISWGLLTLPILFFYLPVNSTINVSSMQINFCIG